eukprot:CAMPEP_0119079130 /NCGR_PEP_ID=MMETSP1178-20130426/105083_1 /TAXON_ID=33656 /ORGANISM="unid sp, Strain CCMP2000" /LENGTH=225 /DNA_ID=CAMNT_0007061629 /DNA_START=95 /DNA_END=772 /DNA_ORIENTATION=-
MWYCLDRPKPKYRGVLHMWCALSSPVWCAYQLSLCDAGNAPAAGLSLFAMAFLFSASSLYHRGSWTLSTEQCLMKLDYIGIYLLVAFSVAPCYVQLLPPTASYTVLGLLALTVVAGVCLTLAELKLGKHSMVAVYVAQAALQLVPMGTSLLSSRSVFQGLLPTERWMLGGLATCYLAGSQVYAHSTPSLWPATFGYHELWHLLIAASVVLTYACNCSVLARPCYA